MGELETTTREEEAELVARLKQGEAAAWQALCERYGEPLYLYALHRCEGDPAAADDIRQEALLAAVQAIVRYRAEVPLFGWLCGIARHKAGDALRKRRREGAPLSRLEESGEDRNPPAEWSSTNQPLHPQAAVEASQAMAPFAALAIIKHRRLNHER